MNSLIQALRQFISELHPAHKRIARGAAWVAVFVIAGKLAGAAKEIGIAWRYGIGELVDAYQLASTLVFWLPGTLVSVISIVLVPMLVRLQQENAEARALFLRELQGAALLIGAGLALFTVVIGPFLLPYLGGKLSEPSHRMTLEFAFGMAPLAPLALLIGLHAARLMAKGRQINTLLEGIPAAAILIFVLLWPPGPHIGPLLWGTLLGTAIETIWLWELGRRSDAGSRMPSFSRRSPHWSELYRAAGVLGVGQLIMSIITPLDQFTAAQLGDGAIATLGYANRIIALLIGVGAIAISRGALPVLAGLHAAGRSIESHRIASRWAGLMLGVGALVAAIAWALAPWGIALLFERGAFTSEDTRVVAEVLRWGLFQIPFYFAGLVLVQLLASQGHYGIIASFAASNLVVKFALNLTLPEWMGIPGITLATSLMIAWSASCLYFAALRTRRRE